MSSTILLSLHLSLLLLLFHSTPVIIQAWTPRLSASHSSSSGRFFHAHNSNSSGGGMKSLRATEKNNQEEDVTNASDDNDDGGSTSDKKNKKKRNKSLENEYLVARLESLYDASAAAVASSSSLLESLTDEYYDQDDVVSSSSSSSPGQSLLYGEENVVVLGDWMEWEEGGSCLGDYCGDDSEQCDIPEHYKEFKGAPKVDVMSFLGIKRAEPIQVQRDWD